MKLIIPLISFAVFLQMLEYIRLARIFPKRELILVGLGASIYCFFIPDTFALILMLVCTVAFGAYFWGTFNGGADSMTFHILAACTAAKMFPEVREHATGYVAGFVALSYFFAGVSKINSKSWRSGEALPKFLRYSNAAFPNKYSQTLLDSKHLTAVVTVAVITFEVLFPLSLLHPSAAMFFLPVGVLFHLANFYLFGLNRFFWAWLAGYPAIWIWVTNTPFSN